MLLTNNSFSMTFKELLTILIILTSVWAVNLLLSTKKSNQSKELLRIFLEFFAILNHMKKKTKNFPGWDPGVGIHDGGNETNWGPSKKSSRVIWQIYCQGRSQDLNRSIQHIAKNSDDDVSIMTLSSNKALTFLCLIDMGVDYKPC